MALKDSAQPFHQPGDDTGVLFLHGFTGSPHAMRAWAERTAEAGHTVAVPRLPGHGTTWQELARTDWIDWYATAEREFLTLTRSCARVFVAALSMGGALALRLAERHPDLISGLLLVNPALTSANRLLPLAGPLHHVMKSQPAIANDIAKPGISEKAYERTPVRAGHQLNLLWNDVRPYLDLVTAPILLFRSAIDHVVPPSSAELIRRQTSSMEIDEVTLLNSFHVATLDWDADLIAERSLDFIAGHPARREDAQPSAAW
ncbi:alpha/beta hydrolase [Nigerium massiliense]|uniref:alpha/beta hydrolase n=1 Tax=Nigerium massiliense TaxID=1522317 RepID=UPI000590E416|nr:alpha/beta fold hydrolase [Nigerium massiliense]